MIGYRTQGNEVKHVIYNGVPCYESLVTKLDRTFDYGDTKESPKWRSQIRTLCKYGRHTDYNFKFKTCIPSDWVQKGRVLIAELHSTDDVHSPFKITVHDNRIKVVALQEVLFEKILVSDSWDEWELDIKFIDDDRGYFNLKCNGMEVVNMKGKTIISGDNYFVAGCYIWTSPDSRIESWPCDYRRMYFQI